MNTHADKTQENKSPSVVTPVSQTQEGTESTFYFVDNRPEAIMQRRLQEMANHSPRILQLKVMQEMANNSIDAKNGIIQLISPEGKEKIAQTFETKGELYNKVLEILDEKGIKYRLGGSFAAKVHGAEREPGDMDIEVEDLTKVKETQECISKVFDKRSGFKYSNEDNICAMIVGDGKVRIELDISNENAEMHNKLRKTPKAFAEDQEVDEEDFVSPEELLINQTCRLIRIRKRISGYITKKAKCSNDYKAFLTEFKAFESKEKLNESELDKRRGIKRKLQRIKELIDELDEKIAFKEDKISRKSMVDQILNLVKLSSLEKTKNLVKNMVLEEANEEVVFMLNELLERKTFFTNDELNIIEEDVFSEEEVELFEIDGMLLDEWEYAEYMEHKLSVDF